MYRCHFMRAGRIAHGCNLKVETLDAAIATGQKILADQIDPDDCDGLEIWLDCALVYEFFCLSERIKPSIVERRR